MENEIARNHEPLEELLPFVDYNEFDEEKFEVCFKKILNFDVNNFVRLDGDSEDSDIEEDHEDECASANMSTIKYKDTNFIEKILCVFQSYVIIHTVTDNNKNTICHYCYYLYQYYRQGGSHSHIHTHVTRKLKYSVNDKHCDMCSRCLYQMVLQEVCIYCNNAKIKLDIDLETKIPIVSD